MGIESDYKRQIFDVLRLISSEREQLDYEQDVPQADVPAELLCCWFDDYYHPSDPHFRSFFSPRELEILASFNNVYDLESKALPPSTGTVRPWLADPGWRRVMTAASE